MKLIAAAVAFFGAIVAVQGQPVDAVAGIVAATPAPPTPVAVVNAIPE